jgi:hypothetical protein
MAGAPGFTLHCGASADADRGANDVCVQRAVRPQLKREPLGREKKRMTYLGVNHEAFDKRITLRQAYQLMYRFVVQYNDRGESSTVALLTDIGIVRDGSSCDPAQIYDFLHIAGEVLDDDTLRSLPNPA